MVGVPRDSHALTHIKTLVRLALTREAGWRQATAIRSLCHTVTRLCRTEGNPQVPIRSGAVSLRSAAITDSAVMRPVLGFSEGMFSIDIMKQAESDSTLIWWQFRATAGSAQISIEVRSGPIPASDSAATTLTSAGNAAAASRAEPLNTQSAEFNPSMEIPLAIRQGAPAKPAGGLRVTICTC